MKQPTTTHTPVPRSLGLDEERDPDRTHVCRACGAESDYEEMLAGECSQPDLFDEAS